MSAAKIKDKTNAAILTITGASINKTVCKAASHEEIGPKKKHIDTLIRLTEDPNVSMPDIVGMLSERLRNSNWVVVFKALITTHNLMVLGNERFLQCMASSTNILYLDSFTDKSSSPAYNMSLYIRRYSRYLRSVLTTYRQLAIDVMKAKKGETGDFQKMDREKLIRSLNMMGDLIDCHLEMNLNVVEMVNGVINTCFLMMYKDLVKLYQAYNDAMISLLEKFFEMKKQQAKEAVEVYKGTPKRLDAMKKFFETAEDLGLETRSHLDLKPVPSDLLPALEEHVRDSDKKGASTSSNTPIKLELRNGPSLSSPKPTKQDSPNQSKSASEFLEEQRKRLEEFSKKRKDSQERPSSATPKTSTSTDVSLSGPPKKQASVDDLLDLDLGASTTTTDGTSRTTSNNISYSSTNPFASSTAGYQEVNFFKGQVNFQAAFGSSNSSGNTSVGDGVLQPEAMSPYASKTQQSKKPPVTKDSLGKSIDEGLAKTAESLTIGGLGNSSSIGVGPGKTQHQWKPATNSQLTGGPNWQPTGGLTATTLPPSSMYMGPYVQGYGGQPMGVTGGAWGGPMMGNMGMQQPYGVGMGVPTYSMNVPGGYDSMQRPAQVGIHQPNPHDPFGPISGGQAKF